MRLYFVELYLEGGVQKHTYPEKHPVPEARLEFVDLIEQLESGEEPTEEWLRYGRAHHLHRGKRWIRRVMSKRYYIEFDTNEELVKFMKKYRMFLDIHQDVLCLFYEKTALYNILSRRKFRLEETT